MAQRFKRINRISVTFLTLGVMVFFAGCSTLQLQTEEDCKYRAYLRTPVDIYISKRFPKDAPVRVGILPFSVPANLSGQGDEVPGLGNELAWRVKEELLSTGILPIVEVLSRQTWPGKRAEFHTGNFEAIEMARNAGYDLVFIGNVERLTSLDSLSAQGKLIETDSGMTVWSGTSTALTNRNDRETMRPHAFFLKREPNKSYTRLLTDELAMCIRKNLMNEEVMPQ